MQRQLCRSSLGKHRFIWEGSLHCQVHRPPTAASSDRCCVLPAGRLSDVVRLPIPACTEPLLYMMAVVRRPSSRGMLPELQWAQCQKWRQGLWLSAKAFWSL